MAHFGVEGDGDGGVNDTKYPVGASLLVHDDVVLANSVSPSYTSFLSTWYPLACGCICLQRHSKQEPEDSKNGARISRRGSHGRFDSSVSEASDGSSCFITSRKSVDSAVQRDVVFKSVAGIGPRRFRGAAIASYMTRNIRPFAKGGLKNAWSETWIRL